MSRKVLLVDGEERLRELYGTHLGRAGYAVHAVSTGRGALRALQRGRRPDVVVLDLHLSDVDGVDLLGKILAADPNLPVILHSSNWADRGHFGCWGARAFVNKSADPTALSRCVQETLKEPGARLENVG